MNYTINDLYDTLKNKKKIGSGLRGNVFVNDDDTLIKVPKEIDVNISYSEFLKRIHSLKKRRTDLKRFEEDQKKFIQKGSNLDFVDFAKDIVYLEEMYIGVIIKWYKNCSSLMEYKFINEIELLEIVKEIIEDNRILITKGIYHLDLLLTNILYNGKNIHIIDIDGNSIKYFPKKNKYYETLSYYSIFRGLDYYLEEKFKNQNSYSDRHNAFNNLLETDDNEFINYSKAKKLIRKIEQKGFFKK